MVYYSFACTHTREHVFADEPDSLFFRLSKNNELGNKLVLKCPAVGDFYKNIFCVRSPYDYELTWTGEGLSTTMYGQPFFDFNVVNRGDGEKGAFSFLFPSLYLLAEAPLKLSVMHPFQENSDIGNKLMMMGGEYDIGRHFRPIEYPYVYKEPSTIRLKRGDVMAYLKFLTEEKIIFKRFFMTQNMIDVTNTLLTRNREYSSRRNPLSYYYNLVEKYKVKNFLLKEIKKNLLD